MTVEKAPKAPRRAARLMRWTILGAVLVAVTAIGILHQKLGAGKPVGVDALCPFGGLETLASLVSSGTLVRRVALSSVFLLGATVGTALLFRRAFCGRICPLGFLQELFARTGQRLLGKRLEMPAALDRPARYLKYVVLAVVLGLTWTSVSLVVRPYDPWVAYQHLSSAEVLAEFGIGLAVLGISLAGSVLYDRFFCKYACPMGAFLGLISRLSLFKVRRDAETCIDCKACDKACPTNVEVSTVDVVNSPECIDCGECVAACPVKDTLGFAAPRSRRLSPVGAGALAVGTFAVLVAGATVFGDFDWTMPTLGDAVSGQGQGQGPGQGGGQSELPAGGTFDTMLIKGSTTLAEVVDATGIPAETFTAIYGVPVAEQSQMLKDLKDRYGCSPGEVRYFVELYRTDPGAAATYVPGTFEESEEH